MKRRFLLLPTLALIFPAIAIQAQQFERPEPKEGFSYPEYFCTNRGIRVDVEDQSCLIIGDRTVQAVCDISLNNPTWRVIGEGCTPTAEVLQAANKK